MTGASPVTTILPAATRRKSCIVVTGLAPVMWLLAFYNSFDNSSALFTGA